MKLSHVLCILILLSGCASVGVTRLGNTPYTAKPITCNIDVFTSESMVKRKFEEICLVDSRTGTTALHNRTASQAINQAKSEACKCGGDAIIVQNTETKGMSMAGWGMGSAIMKVVKYTD